MVVQSKPGRFGECGNDCRRIGLSSIVVASPNFLAVWLKAKGEIVPKDPFVRQKFTEEHTAARKLAKEYFERYPKERYLTEVEYWRYLRSANIEFTMKRLREPIEG